MVLFLPLSSLLQSLHHHHSLRSITLNNMAPFRYTISHPNLATAVQPVHGEIRPIGGALGPQIASPALAADTLKLRTDPVALVLASRAAKDPDLEKLMKQVATSKASPAQLKEFQSHIDEIKALVKRQEAPALEEQDLSLPIMTPIKHGKTDVANHLCSRTHHAKLTTPSPDTKSSAVQLQRLDSLPEKTSSISQPGVNVGIPPCLSPANEESEIEPTNGKSLPLLAVVISPRADELTGSAGTIPIRLGFLDLPAEIRLRIYRYLFGSRQTVKFYHQSKGQAIRAQYPKTCGAGLRFTCQAIEVESGFVYDSVLQWRFMTSGPISMLSLSRFHDTSSVQAITIPSESNTMKLDGIFRCRENLPRLNVVVVHTDGKLRTGNVPSRIEWSEMMDRLQLWSGFPKRLEEVMRQPGRHFAIVLKVECEYYPYMKGKKKFWQNIETRNLRSSEVRIRMLALFPIDH